MSIRSYNSVDLLRFSRFRNENPEIKPMDLMKAYNEKYPELSAKEKLENLMKALNGEFVENITCEICGFFCDNQHHEDNWIGIE